MVTFGYRRWTACALSGVVVFAASGIWAAQAHALQAQPGAVPTVLVRAAPDPHQVKIVVRAGGDRTGNGVGVLAGVTFGVYSAVDADDLVPDGPLLGSCETDPAGTCEVVVGLDADVGNYFTVASEKAPDGWASMTSWGSEGDVYAFNTGGIDVIDVQQVVQIPPDGRRWPTVRADPVAPAQCGIDVGLVIDLSGSVTQDAALFTQYRAAASQFVHALAGTPSRISAFTFASTAGVQGPLPPTALSTADGVDEADSWINALQPSGTDNATNWDQGLQQVVAAGELPDVVLFLTDGDPNRYGNPPIGTGTELHIRDLEEAIASANSLKAAGSRVIAVGIGGSVDGADGQHRLSLISGPQSGSDYVNTSFDALATTLSKWGTANCAGTLTVVKQVRSLATGEIAPAGGWQFDVSSAPSGKPGDPAPTELLTTQDLTGAGNLAVDFVDLAETRTVTVSEHGREGFELEPQDGHNAVCTVDGAQVPVEDDGPAGFRVELKALQTVSCQVVNRELAPPATVTVVKEWSINGVEYPNGQQPTGFNAGLTVPVENGAENGPITWGTPLEGWAVGDTVDIGESVDVPSGCTNTSTGTGGQVITQSTMTFTVLNRVDCDLTGTMAVDKTFISAVRGSQPDTFDVTYRVTVQNLGPLARTYQLSDQLRMAPSVEVLSAKASVDDAAPGAAVREDFDGGKQPVIVDGAAIAAGAVHRYTVIARVRVGELKPSETGCTGAPGAGFFNIATLSPDGGQMLQDDACGPIPDRGAATRPVAPPAAGQPVPAPPVVPIQVLPRAQTRSAPAVPSGSLAYTGAPISAPLTIGLVLVLVGFLLLTVPGVRAAARRGLRR